MEENEQEQEVEVMGEKRGTELNDLPDEILENIFNRVSPYSDMDALQLVSKRWNNIAKKVILSFKNNFEKSIANGQLQCEAISPTYDESGRINNGSWISERFGHACIYHDRTIYIFGGTTYTPTTFNDMWKFDLTTRTWSRSIAGGQYPTPKALASFVNYKDNLVLFGGWAHPSPYPLMQPWRIFDELHVFNVTSNRWELVVTSKSPYPSAGHSATVHDDLMIVFGGRTFNQKEQAYPISNLVWVFDFALNDWFQMDIQNNTTNDANSIPQGRYGQTQITIDDSNLLIIGGCGGPYDIFKDVWLLTFTKHDTYNKRFRGNWTQITTTNQELIPNDFHYSGIKVADKIVFCERSGISPFLAFLHFDQNSSDHNLIFEARTQSHFNSKCSSSLRNFSASASTMPLYTLDISKVVSEHCGTWFKEPEPVKFKRPTERLLYSMVSGRSEIILFGGFYKEANGVKCRVSNDTFILKTIQKIY